VIDARSSHGTDIRITSLERTLVDLAVRPSYAGGAHAVLTAYKKAGSKLSVEKIVAVLEALGHAYPYHQAVGFYLDRSGMSPEATAILQRLGLDFDFYLANQISNPQFDSRWRIYFPSRLEQTDPASSGSSNSEAQKIPNAE
jgi:predicted transcriptional regulator of viral defense system